MLSFALVKAGTFDGIRFSRPDSYEASFSVELRPISDQFDSAALAVNGLDRDRLLVEGADPADAMTSASHWIGQQSLGYNPVLVAYPLGFDWSWLYWYFVRFSRLGSPFQHSKCFDIKTAFAVRARIPVSKAGRTKIPTEWRGTHPHTHRAVDDAIEQAQIFANLFEWDTPVPREGRKIVVPTLIRESRQRTDEKAATLLHELTQRGAVEIANGRACVYATGSMGRGEMSTRSDLDVFVLRDEAAIEPLTKLDEIRLKARLIEAARAQGYPPFSRDGQYVVAHNLKADLIGKLGTEDDDHLNVFTARMLLILESRPILGESTYKKAIEAAVAVYWRDYEQNSNNFLPIFFLNDILRFWKTLCLNYEARTGSKKESKPGERNLFNYKLKHSRLLTCYSAILYLLMVLQRDKGTVAPEVVTQLIGETPTRRLEIVAESRPNASALVQNILESYAAFLETCDEDKNVLESKFADSDFKREQFTKAKIFGDKIYELLNFLGQENSTLLRYLMI